MKGTWNGWGMTRGGRRGDTDARRQWSGAEAVEVFALFADAEFQGLDLEFGLFHHGVVVVEVVAAHGEVAACEFELDLEEVGLVAEFVGVEFVELGVGDVAIA